MRVSVCSKGGSGGRAGRRTTSRPDPPPVSWKSSPSTLPQMLYEVVAFAGSDWIAALLGEDDEHPPRRRRRLHLWRLWREADAKGVAASRSRSPREVARAKRAGVSDPLPQSSEASGSVPRSALSTIFCALQQSRECGHRLSHEAQRQTHWVSDQITPKRL